MKKRSQDPWMPAPTYGHSLHGLTVNLLVRDIAIALPFQREVLAAEIIYHDPDIAVCRFQQAEWMLHADHTYSDHPLKGSLVTDEARGVGAELRLHGRDPDVAEKIARQHDFIILTGAMDKPHGLREAYILDPDGYLWVPDIPIG